MASIFKNDNHPIGTVIVMQSDGMGIRTEYGTVTEDNEQVIIHHGTMYCDLDCTLTKGTKQYPMTNQKVKL